MILPKSREETLAVIHARQIQLGVLNDELKILRRHELSLRPLCPRCGAREGTGTIEVLGCGGDYETAPCPVCREEDFRRVYRD